MMKTEWNPDTKRFLIRLGATTVAVLLVMYLAKVWFVDPGTGNRGGTTLSQSQMPSWKGGIISWRDASQYYGEYTTVEGTIVATHNSGKACYLNFHPDYKRYFTAVIFESAFSRFPAHPENYYDGKKVRVSGIIKEYKGKPEIILEDPSQIEIVN